MTTRTKNATQVTVDLSPKLLEQLDTLCEHYETTRDESLRMAIVIAMRFIGQDKPVDNREAASAIERLRVANNDLQSAIAKIAKVVNA